MSKKEISDKMIDALTVIFEEVTGNKYNVVREGPTIIRIEPAVEVESARADIQTTLDEPDSGQSPKEDRPEPAEKALDDDAVVKAQVVDVDKPFTGWFDLRENIRKFKTGKGWYLKVIDDEEQVDEDGTKWLCSDLVKWIQEIPKHVSKRSADDNRDRAYPARGGGGIYVNDTEMLLLEEMAQKQKIVIGEREFDKQ